MLRHWSEVVVVCALAFCCVSAVANGDETSSVSGTGQVVLRVLIGKNGQALRGDVFQTSGFHRLDQSALKAVLSWRYVPGRVNGQAQDMWFDIPISFKLSN